MPRCEKGLLGVKKDPKKLMLFSFGGGEEWPTSDSADSDYKPSGDEEDDTEFKIDK